MPRLSTFHYLAVHDRLRQLCLAVPTGLAYYLAPNDQLLIHQFFVPLQALTRTELLLHRKTVSAEQPSLPQRAGRALAKFEAQIDAAVTRDHAAIRPTETSVRHRRTRVDNASVRVVLKVPPDLHALARALLRLTPEQIAKLKRGESLRED
jgi:hypothetical protein